MSWCSRILNSTPMQYVYAGAGALGTAASYAGANICVNRLTSMAKVFGEKCPNDFLLNGPYSSKFCEELATVSNKPVSGAIVFYFVAGVAATGTAHAIWRARHYRQLRGPESRALVVHEPELYKCQLLARRPNSTYWLALGLFVGGFVTYLPFVFKMTHEAEELGKCIAWHNATSTLCKDMESFNLTVSTANSVIVSVVGGLWAGIWALSWIRRSSQPADIPDNL